MHWSTRVIGTDNVDAFGGMAMAAHSFEPDGSLHLIVRGDGGDLREFWWTDTTSGSGMLTGHGAPGPKTAENLFELAGSPAVFSPDPLHSLVTSDGSQHVIIAGPRTARSGAFIDLVARP